MKLFYRILKITLITIAVAAVLAITFILLLMYAFFGPRPSYSEKEVFSESGNYSVIAEVNTDISSIVQIHVYNKDKEKIKTINSRASDAQKWSLGWAPNEDIIVMQSSDIGDYAWTIRDDKIIDIQITEKLRKVGDSLYLEKYGENKSISRDILLNNNDEEVYIEIDSTFKIKEEKERLLNELLTKVK